MDKASAVAVILHAGSLATTIAKPANGRKFTLTELQGIVGGYIEIVAVPNHQGMVIVLNEEGKLSGLPVNELATIMYNNPHDVIVGDVLLAKIELID